MRTRKTVGLICGLHFANFQDKSVYAKIEKLIEKKKHRYAVLLYQKTRKHTIFG